MKRPTQKRLLAMEPDGNGHIITKTFVLHHNFLDYDWCHACGNRTAKDLVCINVSEDATCVPIVGSKYRNIRVCSTCITLVNKVLDTAKNKPDERAPSERLLAL